MHKDDKMKIALSGIVIFLVLLVCTFAIAVRVSAEEPKFTLTNSPNQAWVIVNTAKIQTDSLTEPQKKRFDNPRLSGEIARVDVDGSVHIKDGLTKDEAIDGLLKLMLEQQKHLCLR